MQHRNKAVEFLEFLFAEGLASSTLLVSPRAHRTIGNYWECVDH